ncbi:MAG: XdhC family protein [Candidatus Thermoplasmatota archaeon]|nr:XdhC family protein [Candidatus Thermoplasmatota archaeon]
MDEEILSRMAESIKENREFVMVEVIEGFGSTPGKPGFKMLVFEDEIFGTIGGGALEKKAIDDAKGMLKDGERIKLEDINLEKEGMMCGGSVKLLLEKFSAKKRITLFGAGHVAKAFAEIAKMAGFSLRVVDDRERLLSSFEGCETVLGRCEEVAEKLSVDKDYAVIMTKSHDEDLEVLKRLIDKECLYLGVIGSKRKAIEFARALGENRMKRVRMPAGIEIGSQTPAEIAISIIAEIIADKNVRNKNFLRG